MCNSYVHYIELQLLPCRPVSDSVEERMMIGARWILRVKGRKLTQSCVEELLGDVTDLFSFSEDDDEDPLQVWRRTKTS